EAVLHATRHDHAAYLVGTVVRRSSRMWESTGDQGPLGGGVARRRLRRNRSARTTATTISTARDSSGPRGRAGAT
ncbi:MAG TPA: hypothetical protein VEL81_01645, partial [Thermoplasmata archaeon]|nr:hypothetical protein [Thermoplasmata archaeon]